MLFMTARLDVTPKITEQNLIVRIGKSEAAVTNNETALEGIVLLNLTTDRQELASAAATVFGTIHLSQFVIFSSFYFNRFNTDFTNHLFCDDFANCRRNIMKISLFYGDIKFSTFTQNEAYDVKTLLGKTYYSTHACSVL